jgi:hypothetical protein
MFQSSIGVRAGHPQLSMAGGLSAPRQGRGQREVVSAIVRNRFVCIRFSRVLNGSRIEQLLELSR